MASTDRKDGDANAISSAADEKYGSVSILQKANGTVKPKYVGTDADRHEMKMLGKQQVLRVRLHSIALSNPPC